MVTKVRDILPLNFYHIYSRGAHRDDIFKTEEDFNYFLSKVIKLKDCLKLKILAYSCAYNHYHFFIEEPSQTIINSLDLKGSCRSAISNFVSRLENSYTQYYNSAHNHSGVIFEGVFKSKHINYEKYFENLVYYINLNAVKHNLVREIKDWKYTSHHEYITSGEYEFHIVDRFDFLSLDMYRNNLIKYRRKFKLIEKSMSDCLIDAP
jgi:REP-associated tyrosine transposase